MNIKKEFIGTFWKCPVCEDEAEILENGIHTYSRILVPTSFFGQPTAHICELSKALDKIDWTKLRKIQNITLNVNLGPI